MWSLLDIAAQVVAGHYTCAEIEGSMYALDEPMLKKVTDSGNIILCKFGGGETKGLGMVRFKY